jgi:hypothetical protein
VWTQAATARLPTAVLRGNCCNRPFGRVKQAPVVAGEAPGGFHPGKIGSYNIVRDPVEVYDLNATVLDLLRIDRTRLTFKFPGRDYRLTDVHGKVVKALLA